MVDGSQHEEGSGSADGQQAVFRPPSSVVILGLARQGTALARFLAGQGMRVTVSDLRSAEQLQESVQALAGLGIAFVLGAHPERLLDGCDLLCLSGGVDANAPLPRLARERGIPLSNDAQIFLEHCPTPKTIGITGSAGKTTTTTLTGLMLSVAAEQAAWSQRSAPNPPNPQGSAKVWVGGNIGNPLIADLAAMTAHDQVVLELSSFQLEVMTRSTRIAAVLNITPNHLDRHGTMAAYIAAKANLLRHQGPDTVAVLGKDDAQASALAPLVRGRLAWFSDQGPVGEGAFLRGEVLAWRWDGQEHVVIRADQIQLRGAHNVRNVLAAIALSGAAGAPPEAMAEVARTFTGVPHRLEVVRDWRGVRWINDSIASTPERAMAGIRAFDQPLVLLAGGRDKKLPWDAWAALVNERVRQVIAFGEAADLIERALAEVDFPTERLTRAEGLTDAVQAAARLAQPGDVVLLSPGGTSFDEFADFEARGRQFAQLVQALR